MKKQPPKSQRQIEREERAEKAKTAREHEARCRAEMVSPSPDLSYVQPSTWEHLAESWKATAERLEKPPVRDR